MTTFYAGLGRDEQIRSGVSASWNLRHIPGVRRLLRALLAERKQVRP